MKIGDVVECNGCPGAKPCIGRVMSMKPLRIQVIVDLTSLQPGRIPVPTGEICDENSFVGTSHLRVLKPTEYLQYLL